MKREVGLLRSAASASWRNAFRRSAAQLVRERLARGNEFQRNRVDAVAKPGWRRTVRNYMALMGAATAANDLSPYHPVPAVPKLEDMVIVEWKYKARPTRSAVELCLGREQRQAAQPAAIKAVPRFLEEQAAKGRLSAAVEQDLPFFVVEAGLELLIFLMARRR